MAKQKSFKTAFEYGDAADYSTTVTWTKLANVVEIKPPSLKSEEVETTDLDAPNEMKDALPTLGDNEAASLKLQFDPDQYATMLNLFRIKRGFRVVYSNLPYPSGHKLRFNGWISELQNEPIQKDNLVEQTITVRVVGLPDFQKTGT